MNDGSEPTYPAPKLQMRGAFVGPHTSPARAFDGSGKCCTALGTSETVRRANEVQEAHLDLPGLPPFEP